MKPRFILAAMAALGWFSFLYVDSGYRGSMADSTFEAVGVAISVAIYGIFGFAIGWLFERMIAFIKR